MTMARTSCEWRRRPDAWIQRPTGTSCTRDEATVTWRNSVVFWSTPDVKSDVPSEPSARASTSALCALKLCACVPFELSQNLTLPIESPLTTVPLARTATVHTTVCSPLSRSSVMRRLPRQTPCTEPDVGTSKRRIVELEQPATR